MNMKKLLALLMAFMLVLSMAACSSEEEKGGASTGIGSQASDSDSSAAIIAGSWTATIDYGPNYRSGTGIDVGSLPATLTLTVNEAAADDEGRFEYYFASIITEEALAAAAQRGMNAAASLLTEDYEAYHWTEEDWINELRDKYALEEEMHYGTFSGETFDGGIGIAFTMSEVSEDQFTATFENNGIVAVFNSV